jgi:hypothetical protein
MLVFKIGGPKLHFFVNRGSKVHLSLLFFIIFNVIQMWKLKGWNLGGLESTRRDNRRFGRLIVLCFKFSKV